MSEESNLMHQVPVVSAHDIDDLSPDIRRVSGLAVDHSTSQPVLVLSVGCDLFQSPNATHYDFALSPPAAAQLSRLLRKAMKSYLHGKLDQ